MNARPISRLNRSAELMLEVWSETEQTVLIQQQVLGKRISWPGTNTLTYRYVMTNHTNEVPTHVLDFLRGIAAIYVLMNHTRGNFSWAAGERPTNALLRRMKRKKSGFRCHIAWLGGHAGGKTMTDRVRCPEQHLSQPTVNRARMLAWAWCVQRTEKVARAS